MSAKKYAKNLMDFVKEEDKRQKLTVLISSENKDKIRKYGINSSKLIDAFLSDFFAEIEKEERRGGQAQKAPNAHSRTETPQKSTNGIELTQIPEI